MGSKGVRSTLRVTLPVDRELSLRHLKSRFARTGGRAPRPPGPVIGTAASRRAAGQPADHSYVAKPIEWRCRVPTTEALVRLGYVSFASIGWRVDC
jgi:hypothetical protein